MPHLWREEATRSGVCLRCCRSSAVGGAVRLARWDAALRALAKRRRPPSGGRHGWAGVGTACGGAVDAAKGPALVRAWRRVASAMLGRLAFRAPGAQIAAAPPAS